MNTSRIDELDRIHVENLEVFCNHGVYREENILGQKFLVSCSLYLNTRKAGLSDEISDSVSYGNVCRCIAAGMKEQNDKLLERVAERLASTILLTFPSVCFVELEVKKPWAPVMMHIDHASVKIRRGWHQVYVGVGSNLGDREKYMDYAKEQVSGLPDIRNFRMAEQIETAPYGYENQGDFLNNVFAFETLAWPEELLESLQKIEQGAKRKREGIHWGPRTLDLDILLYDDLVTEKPELIIPHPDMENRLFVLEPLCQLNPYGVHPVSRRRFIDILKELKAVLPEEKN